jgi:hypothetical protein
MNYYNLVTNNHLLTTMVYDVQKRQIDKLQKQINELMQKN